MTFQKHKPEQYEDTTFDIPDIPAWEGKLNPDAHIHFALINLQKMLTHEQPEVGFVQYAAAVDHIEVICRAAKRLTENYDNSISETKTNLQTENLTEYIFLFRLAQYKLQKLLEECFNFNPIKTMGRV